MSDKIDNITVSDDLIMTPQELHATSLTRPSGFLLTWMEMFGDGTDPDHVGVAV